MKAVAAGLSILSLLAVAAAARAGDAPVGEAASPRPRLLLLATGGTIAGASDPGATVRYQSGKLSPAALISAVPGLDRLAAIDAEQVASIGSQDMNDELWFALARRISSAFDRNLADGVVITHGTDTMEETAFFLNLVLPRGKPVVLVGAMRPASAPSADGPANLMAAAAVAASSSSRGRGVLVVLNDTIHLAAPVYKGSTQGVAAFRSSPPGPAGYVDREGPHFWLPPPRSQPQFRLPSASPLPRVEIVYGHSQMDGAAIADAIRLGARGIVLAGMGEGNASRAALEALARAAANGVPVIRASRIDEGWVGRNVEVDDDRLGFTAAVCLNPQKARILLQLLIANGIKDAAEIQRSVDAVCNPGTQ